MKKPVALALLLALALILGSASALAESYAISGVGSVQLPDGYDVDDTTYTYENTDTSQWKFLAADSEMLLECYYDQLDDYAGVSLANDSPEELQTYIDDTVAAFTNESTVVSVVETVRGDSGVPFVIYAMTDDIGSFYYAETILDGWCLSLSFYTEAGDTLPSSRLPELKTILSSFQPAV